MWRKFHVDRTTGKRVLKIAFRNLAYNQGYEIEVIILPTQHPVRMALLFSFLKILFDFTFGEFN